MTAAWEPAPVGQVLVPGACRTRDADGQGCARGVVHLLHPHRSTGLRAWLESSEERAIIRIYPGDRADELEAMEAPLLARFQYVPVARQEFVEEKDGGLNTGWVVFVGVWAPTEHVTFHARAVAYARPW